jgi:hemerythrin-like domain-containing protein
MTLTHVKRRPVARGERTAHHGKEAPMSDSPTEVLREEHELVLMVVEAMEREVASIETTDHVNADRVANMIDFTKNFTDGCHHAKEERILFPLLTARPRSRW